MKEEHSFDQIAHLFYGTIKEQMITGMLPSQEVLDTLQPLLVNYHQIYPKLEKSVQKDIQIILNIYPEISEEYNIHVKQKRVLYYYWLLQDIIIYVFTLPEKCLDFVCNSFKISINKRWLIGAPAFAFACLMVFMILPSDPSLSHKMISQLNIQNTLQPGIDVSKNIYALTPSSESVQQHIFRMGFHIASLDLSIHAKNPTMALKYLIAIKNDLTGQVFDWKIEKNDDLMKFIDDLNQTDNNDLKSFKKLSFLLNDHSQSILKNSNESIDIYNFAQWTAITRALVLSPQKDNTTLLKSLNFDMLLFDKIKMHNIPKGVIINLNKIIEISNLSQLTSIDIRVLAQNIKSIMNLMGNFRKENTPDLL